MSFLRRRIADFPRTLLHNTSPTEKVKGEARHLQALDPTVPAA